MLGNRERPVKTRGGKMENTITRKPINHRYAAGNTHFEYSSDGKEIEIYIGSWFLASVDVKDISEQAADYLFI